MGPFERSRLLACGRAVSALCLLWHASPGRTQAAAPPIRITLSEAIRRAQTNEPVLASAVAAQRNAQIDRYLTKAALLPTVTYHNQVLYTQPNGQTNQGGQAGTQPSPVFIANNAIHEYTSQASINETVGFRQFAEAGAAAANAARATAELEVVRRGLVSAVVTLYYAVAAAAARQRLLEEALREAATFTDLTQKRETAREVAHADVVKAQLQQQGRQRDLSDANLAAERSRLELGVLLFPDPRTAYDTAAPEPAASLPDLTEVNQLASANNPEIRSALSELRAGDGGVTAARAAYLPDLALNFTYGLDAPQFARRGIENVQNLGYSIAGTLDIPIWDWFSTQKRVKQSENLRDASRVNLTAAERRLIATLQQSYSEAAAARDQLGLLDQSVRTAAESLQLTKLRYAAGESTALEVVDAQNAYLTAGLAQADGNVRYRIALNTLQILTGTL